MEIIVVEQNEMKNKRRRFKKLRGNNKRVVVRREGRRPRGSMNRQEGRPTFNNKRNFRMNRRGRRNNKL